MAAEARVTVSLGRIKEHPAGQGYAIQLVFNGVPGRWLWISAHKAAASLGADVVRHARLTDEQVADWPTLYEPGDGVQQET